MVKGVILSPTCGPERSLARRPRSSAVKSRNAISAMMGLGLVKVPENRRCGRDH